MSSRHGRRVADISGEFVSFHVGAVQTTAVPLPQNAAQALAAGTPVLDYGHGVFLQAVMLNDTGSGTWTVTLYNGDPLASGTMIAAIKTTSIVSLKFGCVLDKGLWYKYTGGTTAGSITFRVLPVGV